MSNTHERKNKIAASFCTDKEVNIRTVKKLSKVTQTNDSCVNDLAVEHTTVRPFSESYELYRETND